MRTTETIYKTTGDNYRVKIWDVVNTEWIYLGTVKGIENALERLKNEQIDYYKDKVYLLPKCITIDYKNKCFYFAVYYNKKTIIKKRCTTLESAILEKQNFLLKLL